MQFNFEYPINERNFSFVRIPCLIPRFQLKIRIKRGHKLLEEHIDYYKDPSLIPDQKLYEVLILVSSPGKLLLINWLCSSIRSSKPIALQPKLIKVQGLTRPMSRKEEAL